MNENIYELPYELDYITQYDTGLLLKAGFTFGISSEFLWGTDKEGNRWQAVEEGEFYKFGVRTDKNIILTRASMSREEFEKKFLES